MILDTAALGTVALGTVTVILTDTAIYTVEIRVQSRVIDGESLSECECDSFVGEIVLFLISSSSSQSSLIPISVGLSNMSVPPI